MKAPLVFAAASVLCLAPLGACATVSNIPGSAWPAETPVPLGQAVRVGDLTATPIKVVEDSRCPMNARCVWAGRLVVQTRIDGKGWRETANLTLGQIHTTHGQMLALAGVRPEKTTDHRIEPRDYRFTYERRDDRLGGPPPPPKP
ncbi:hypothetical protein [Sphingomonas flavescens]|uniref:hypothetical protein n=1 Tax=Sphingomonas flavescens TaxID=3132797 RepID=UPI002805133E|nr:hypothetical protein [Sphingomonas limnosediminicola]